MRADVGFRANGYGPLLAAGAHVWAARGRTFAALDAAKGEVAQRLQIEEPLDLTAIDVAGDMCALDTARAWPVRFPLGGQRPRPGPRTS